MYIPSYLFNENRVGNLRTPKKNRMFGEYLLAQETHHQTTCSYTLAQSRVAEKKNRHLLQVARSTMISMNVPK
jgi:hypothetical protein